MPSMGSGAAEGLQEVLKNLFLKAQQQQQMQIAQQRLSEDARQADMQQALGQGQLGLGGRRIDQDAAELGFRQSRAGVEDTRYDEQAPSRAADVAYKGALTGELIRKPQVEEGGRQFTLGRDKTQHGYTMGEIGARNAGDMAVVNARQAAAAKPEQNVAEEYTTERRARTRQSVNELEKKVSSLTTGVGSLLAKLPATDARNFVAELETLKSNIGFNELTEMRAASKTGGALGQVSDREISLLTSTLGALDPGQSPANFKAQLKKIGDSLDRWEKAKTGATTPAQAPLDPQALIDKYRKK